MHARWLVYILREAAAKYHTEQLLQILSNNKPL